MIEAVLFDLDGTLFDHRGAAQDAVRHMVDRFDLTRAFEELAAAWFASEELHMSTYLAGDCTFPEQRRRRVRDIAPLLGVHVPSTERETDEWFATNYLRAYERSLRCFPEVPGVIEMLTTGGTAVITGVVTNGDPTQQRRKVDRIGLLGTIGPILTPTELGTAKPDPSSFRTACRLLDTVPERTIYVGDSPAVDALGAHRAGLVGVWLDRGAHGSAGADIPDGCDLSPVTRITDLNQMLPLIR